MDLTTNWKWSQEDEVWASPLARYGSKQAYTTKWKNTVCVEGGEVVWLGAWKEKVSVYLLGFFAFFLLWCFPIINGTTRRLKWHDAPDLKSESWGISEINLD